MSIVMDELNRLHEELSLAEINYKITAAEYHFTEIPPNADFSVEDLHGKTAYIALDEGIEPKESLTNSLIMTTLHIFQFRGYILTEDEDTTLKIKLTTKEINFDATDLYREGRKQITINLRSAVRRIAQDMSYRLIDSTRYGN